MIRIFITAVLYLITMFTQAQETSGPVNTQEVGPVFDIRATVKQIKTDKGTVFFALYSSAESFAERKPLQAKKVNATMQGVEVTFEDVPKGTYAISCFYDQNGNGKMDFDANGMPQEDFGFSNNVMSFGPPVFSDAKFEVTDKDLTFDIRF